MSENKIILRPNNDDEKIVDLDKRRHIIKNILIIFLAILLILTFFSNTIMNSYLPEIATEKSISGTITEALSASGSVESNQSYEVKVDSNMIIEAIKIKTGKEVKKGDVLFTVNTDESPELVEAQNTLKLLEQEYEKMLLVMPNDYSAQNLAIKNLREDLQNAINQRDNLINQQSDNDAKTAEYNQAKIDYANKTNEIANLQSYSSALSMDDVYTIGNIYSQNLITLYDTYNLAKESQTNAENELATLTSSPTVTEEALQALQDKVNQRSEYALSCKSAYDTEKSSVMSVILNDIKSAEDESVRLNTIIMTYESNMSSSDNSSIEALNAEITAKQRELESLQLDLQSTIDQDNLAQQSTNIDIEAKLEQIEKQKEVVNKLKEKVETSEIVAEYSGVISSISIGIGETTIPDTALATIDISSEGYTMSVSVDAEKVAKVKVGSTVKVLNDWSNSINVELVEIASDPTDKKLRKLTFNVSGNTNSGNIIQISIPCSTDKYDTIIPKSALNEDSNGKFVLVVKSKSSPLGNRYYAERVDVETLASDDVSIAVQGSINMGDYVITTSSKPIEAGDQVKMKE